MNNNHQAGFVWLPVIIVAMTVALVSAGGVTIHQIQKSQQDEKETLRQEISELRQEVEQQETDIPIPASLAPTPDPTPPQTTPTSQPTVRGSATKASTAKTQAVAQPTASVPAIVERVFLEVFGDKPTESGSTYWKNQLRNNNLTEAQLKSQMQNALTETNKTDITATVADKKTNCLQTVALLKIKGNKMLRDRLAEKEKEYREAMYRLRERRADIINEYSPELSPDQNRAIRAAGVSGVDAEIQALERQWQQIKANMNQVIQDTYQEEELKCEAGI